MALTRLGLNQAINLTSNVTGTLPVANGGTNLSSGFINGTTAVGKVLQVVSAQSTSNTLVETTSFVETQPSINITPSATSSKIAIFYASAMGYQNTSSQSFYAFFSLQRTVGGTATNLGNSTSAINGVYYHGVTYNDIWGGAGFPLLDSPNTTSQCTYVPIVRVSTTDADYYTKVEGQHNIIAMEIGA
jgi:hypothetical protein